MTATINVACNGNNPDSRINRVAQAVKFGTSGNCTFTWFQFVDANRNGSGTIKNT